MYIFGVSTRLFCLAYQRAGRLSGTFGMCSPLAWQDEHYPSRWAWRGRDSRIPEGSSLVYIIPRCWRTQRGRVFWRPSQSFLQPGTWVQSGWLKGPYVSSGFPWKDSVRCSALREHRVKPAPVCCIAGAIRRESEEPLPRWVLRGSRYSDVIPRRGLWV